MNPSQRADAAAEDLWNSFEPESAIGMTVRGIDGHPAGALRRQPVDYVLDDGLTPKEGEPFRRSKPAGRPAGDDNARQINI